MKDCRRTGERLTPYVDEALPPAERREVERHLDACPPCRQDALEEQGGKQLVRECADRLRQSPLPPGLRSRCEALAREHSRAQAGSWRARLMPAILMVALVLFVVVAILPVATRRSDALLAAQLTADHVKCFELFQTDETIDPARVERELEARYGWDVHVPPSSPEHGLRLVGGRRCLYAEGSIPHVMYRAGSATVSLFRLEGVTRREADVTTMGYRSRVWSRGGNTFVLVVPASAPVPRLARYVRQEAR